MAGKKFDHNKARVSLIFTKALLEVAKVGTKGAKKYSDHNWRGGMEWSRLLDANLRHLLEFNAGNMLDIDPNCKACQRYKCKDHTGELHLAQAAWNNLALLEYLVANIGTNDLWKGYKKGVKHVTNHRPRKRLR